MKEEALTQRVIGCFFTAYNEMGFGLPERVYSAALEILFRDIGLAARREHPFDVIFRDCKVGTYRVDYLIEDTLILELKAGHQLPPGSRAQLFTYLRTSRKTLGLLLRAFFAVRTLLSAAKDFPPTGHLPRTTLGLAPVRCGPSHTGVGVAARFPALSETGGGS